MYGIFRFLIEALEVVFGDEKGRAPKLDVDGDMLDDNNKLTEEMMLCKAELCLEAVKQDGRTLKYVDEQSSILCVEAAKEQTPQLCLEFYYDLCEAE
jgi:hypothetical protein